jgi:DNA-binding GntR family transcriptional regulator
VTGHYPPGARLAEGALADEFQVSRTPVREVLRALAAEGMAEMRGRRGVIVSAPTLTRLLEMFDVTAELEAMCAGLAARRLRAGDELRLTRAQDDCWKAAKAGDTERYFHANEAFHKALYLASGSGFLIDQAASLYRRLAPYRRMQFRIRDRLKQSHAEHAKILEAILSSDAAAASDHARDHITIHGNRFADLVAILDRVNAGADTGPDDQDQH